MVATEPLINARVPDQSDGPLGGLQIGNAVRDIVKYVVPRFASTAVRNAAYAAWVTNGNTMAPGMECTTLHGGGDGVLCWRYTGTAWTLTGWVGDDKADQPMISLNASQDLGTAGTLYQLQTADWDSVIDHGAGLLTLVGGAIRCGVPGRVRVEAFAVSDASTAGWSWLAVGIPFEGGNHLGGLDDRGARATGYPGAGQMRQRVTDGPIAVETGDLITYSLAQQNTASAAVTYQCYLAVTYV